MSRDILSRANVEVLAQFASSNVVVAFDFDGTLAPIVDDPDEAKMRGRTRELLVRLCRLYPSIVVSGRGREDVRNRLRGVGLIEIIGNHGLEPWRSGDTFAKAVRGWIPVLEKRLKPFKGVVIEDKGFSVAVHYRKSRQKRAAKAAIVRAVESLSPLRVIPGHQVVNLLPPGAPHKGIALAAARERMGCDTALYVGDDETDEDVFALDQPGRLLTVRVGQKHSSRAAFFLADQLEVDAFIETLLALRTRPAVSMAGAR